MSVTPTPVNLQGKQDFFSFLWGGGAGNFHNFLFCFLSIFHRGDGGSEAGRGRREANMLNVYDKCPTLKHLSQEIVLIALPLLFLLVMMVDGGG